MLYGKVSSDFNFKSSIGHISNRGSYYIVISHNTCCRTGFYVPPFWQSVISDNIKEHKWYNISHHYHMILCKQKSTCTVQAILSISNKSQLWSYFVEAVWTMKMKMFQPVRVNLSHLWQRLERLDTISERGLHRVYEYHDLDWCVWSHLVLHIRKIWNCIMQLKVWHQTKTLILY